VPTLTHLLSTSDIISVNCPLNEQTTSLLSYPEFAAMKDGVFIINTARGAVIHEEALIAALESGKVARAGLDVFPDEPNVNPYFRESDKVVLQPHLGGLTDMAYQRAETECFENVRALFRDGRPISPVVEIKDKETKEI
jgi:phosphoglycerate dehydrogenase-like enzyme